jgi:hypothetical protein
MTKHELHQYLAIIGLCICMCLGMKWVTDNIDSLAKNYNNNSHKTPLKKGAK